MSVLAAIAIIAGDLVVIGTALGWGWHKLESVRQMAVDWHGQPERKDPTGTVIDPARPGVQGRLVRLEAAQTEAGAKLAAIDKELHPNSGSSFRDVVLADVAFLKTAVAELRGQRAASSTVEAS